MSPPPSRLPPANCGCATVSLTSLSHQGSWGNTWPRSLPQVPSGNDSPGRQTYLSTASWQMRVQLLQAPRVSPEGKRAQRKSWKTHGPEEESKVPGLIPPSMSRKLP